MRKKGRPNPEQRYFQLVVGLHAHTYTGYYPIISHASERIIVRASNPGQFEGDVDLCCWQRGITQNSIFHQGKIGINTDMPDEVLVVNGNLKVSGHIIQPSDERVKHNICELNTEDQLENVNQIRVVRYQYDSSFAGNNELDSERYQTGIIAQELQKILPDAVHNGGNVRLANGTNIDNFLQVNKVCLCVYSFPPAHVTHVKAISRIAFLWRALAQLSSWQRSPTAWRSASRTSRITTTWEFSIKSKSFNS
jgi:myelin regulatory factor